MKPQTLVMMLVAVGCGLAALFLSQSYLKRAPGGEEEKESVYVAVADIESGTKIDETMIRVAPVSKSTISLYEDAIRDKDSVVGKTAKFQLSKNEIFRSSRVGDGEGMDAMTPPGMRQVSIKIKTERGVAGFIKKGSRVDLLLIPTDSRTANQVVVLLSDVQVTAINNKLSSDKGSTDGTALETVTFLVSTQEAAKLALAEELGTIKLTLRSSGDKGQIDLAAVTRESILGSHNPMDADRKKLDETEPAKAILTEKKPEKSGGGFLSQFSQFVDQAKKTSADGSNIRKTSVAEAPKPPKRTKKMFRVYYRDLAGNPLMEAVIPADSKLAESLKDVGEVFEQDEEEAKADEEAKKNAAKKVPVKPVQPQSTVKVPQQVEN